MRNQTFDVVVVGGGLVGVCVAYGLAKGGARVAVLDEGDIAFRASRANFGVVWVQGKLDGLPAYAEWTRLAASEWSSFAQELVEASGIDVEFESTGGVGYCIGEAEFQAKQRWVDKHHAKGNPHQLTMLDRSGLEGLLPEIEFGSKVTGASYCPHDGGVNPLNTFYALHAAVARLGVQYFPGRRVLTIEQNETGYRLKTDGGDFLADKTVLAAGLGIEGLARDIGINVELTPERGQLLVTERATPLIRMPGAGLRQFDNGTIVIGSSRDRPGFNVSTTVGACADIALRATEIIPALRKLRIIRTWAGLRILTPDHAPIYAQDIRGRGFVVTCHSGVTLAPLHARQVASAVLQGRVCSDLGAFQLSRFTNAA